MFDLCQQDLCCTRDPKSTLLDTLDNDKDKVNNYKANAPISILQNIKKEILQLIDGL